MPEENQSGDAGRPALAAMMTHLETLGRTHGRREIFRDFCAMAAAAIEQRFWIARLGEMKTDVEARWDATARAYTALERDAFSEMLAITLRALEERDCDFLGQVYMQAGIGRSRGQNFTPWRMAVLTAALLVGDAGAERRRLGRPLLFNDPACGSGVMALAAASAVATCGLDPSRDIVFFINDAEPLCVDMAYIQLSLKGLTAIVAHADTMTLTVARTAPTPAWTWRHVPEGKEYFAISPKDPVMTVQT